MPDIPQKFPHDAHREELLRQVLAVLAKAGSNTWLDRDAIAERVSLSRADVTNTLPTLELRGLAEMRRTNPTQYRINAKGREALRKPAPQRKSRANKRDFL